MAEWHYGDCESCRLSRSKNYVHVYTDGCCLNNGKCDEEKRAGIGVYFPDYSDLNVSQPASGTYFTNQRAELEAAIVALKIGIANQMPGLILHTDSEHVQKGITLWIKEWKRNGWKNDNNQGRQKSCF